MGKQLGARPLPPSQVGAVTVSFPGAVGGAGLFRWAGRFARRVRCPWRGARPAESPRPDPAAPPLFSVAPGGPAWLDATLRVAATEIQQARSARARMEKPR